MAIPSLPADHGTFSPVLQVGQKTRMKAMRIAAAGAVVVFACAAVVAMVGVSTETELAQVPAVKMPSANVEMLAEYFLKHGAQLSDRDALSTVKAWTKHPTMETATLMGSKDAATMMLAMAPARMTLAESSKLCEKKDMILELFDRLLAKLGGEELSANITFGKISDEWSESMSSWLDSESKYRLTVEQVKEAKQGSAYASDEYEKWKTEERQNLADEREVIKEILRYLGVLHDVKATEKSIAAGGRDSVIDPETGVSETKAITPAKLKAKIAQLQALVARTNQPSASQKLAQIQKLPVYSETEEVAKILKEMLSDLQTRLSILEEVDKKAQEIADEARAKMVEWEGKLVTLSDEADKAKEKMMAEKLQREQLAGTKDEAQSTYDNAKDEYTKVITPYEREIYVITMIKVKITEHCDKLAAGEDSTFGA